MIDQGLLKLLGKDKKYIYLTVLFMLLGLLGNIIITFCLCLSIYLASTNQPFIGCFIVAGVVMIIRYMISIFVGDLKEVLGRNVRKNLREQVYQKMIKLSVKSTNDMSMAGLTQVAMEGIEQLDLYYPMYIPQFFYAMIAPVILFAICVGIEWKVALVLLCCVPLIPISIIGVSKYAKKIFSKYWGKYTSMGDHFLYSVQGLKDLKIFSADKMQHLKKNQTSEEFRKITMKVVVMQLASTTIMDFVAYGGAGPLSLALGFGEVTMKRYTLGVVPTKEYSCIIRKALESPIYFKSLLEKNKDKLNSSAYKKAKAASEKLCQMTNMSDTILATISYIFYRLDEVTPLALQKILYFCQGHHLLKFNKPLFTEDCLAWDHGPVYRKVYDLFKKLTYHVIEDDYYAVIKNRHLSLGDEQKEVIDLVLETYGLFNGKVLEHITHQQAPYNNTNHNEIIEKGEITNYYKTLKE